LQEMQGVKGDGTLIASKLAPTFRNTGNRA
jgi:hypothetical protein